MKKFLLILTSVFATLSSFAQIETVIINGKMHYVYPYQAEVRDYSRQYTRYADKKEILIRDEKNQKIVNITYEDFEHSPKTIKESKKASKEFISRMETEKGLMASFRNDLMKDITPALEKLPDGLYVQYYRDIPYIKDRVLRYRNDVIAGVFNIKNNQLDGESSWYDFDGDIIKKGKYFNGSKFGIWIINEYEANYDRYYEEVLSKMTKEELAKGEPPMVFDTICEKVEFKNGIRNGLYVRLANNDTLTSGSYFQDNEANTWRYFGYKQVKAKDSEGKWYWKTTNELILIKQYTVNRNGESRAKSRMFRESAQNRDTYYEYDYYYYDEGPPVEKEEEKFYFRDTTIKGYYEVNFPDFTSFYAVAIQKEDLDLPNEEYHSFEGSEEGYYDYEGGYYYDDYLNKEDESDSAKYNRINENDVTIRIDGKRYLLNHVIDSIGYHFHYQDELVEYHQNGQLKYRYIIENGKLKEESPVYFDNGQIANKISFDADSNIYKQEFFDYYGKLYKTIRYDINGKAFFEEVNEEEINTVTVDNLLYNINWGASTLSYSARKDLEKGLVSKQLIGQELWKYNKKIAGQTYFDPVTKEYKTIDYTLGNKEFRVTEITFGEEYKSLSGKSRTTFKNVQLDVVFSGAYEPNRYFGFGMDDEVDTTTSPQLRILGWQRLFDIDRDYTLSVNNQPFTGKITGSSGKSSYKFKATDKSIVFQIPNSKVDLKYYNKTLKAFAKGKETPLLDAYVPDLGTGSQLTETPSSVLSDLAYLKVYGGGAQYQLDTAYSDAEEVRKNYYSSYNDIMKKRPIPSSMTGSYINGKPAGPWQVKDQFNHVLLDYGYKNGEMDGVYTYYDLAMPKEKLTKKQLKRMGYDNNYDYYSRRGDRIPKEYQDSVPTKKTYYTRYVSTLVNGKAQGWAYEFNWLGDTINGTQYVDGEREGVSFTRNKLVYSREEFEDGVEDGVSRAWLTPIGKDSILLYELGFQNGALQGKSVTYHTNGKIAKKGFFLSGQPIDDYEAYDTLGNLYQFVKFQYNQPVQEKIWEENKLSVLYEFDWKDSVNFRISDIITSTSASRYMQDIGFRDGSVYAPYLGRPSVLEKTGVDYKMTKYYPNDTIARTGQVVKGKKTGIWNYYNYYGKKLMVVNYFDSIIKVNDSLKFNSKGILTYVDEKGNELSKSWIIEKFEKYDCAHTDHNEERMLYCFWEKDTTQHRMNGYVKNYYDNGSIQNEGMVKNGLPVGIWKMYDVDGRLSQVGTYDNGKRTGRWLSGDLGNVKNMSEICLNPNLQNLDEILKYQENLLDISVIYYEKGREIRREYYGINKNNKEAPEGFEGDDGYYDYYEYMDGE